MFLSRGGAEVNGKGEVIGGRAIITLPQDRGSFKSLRLGMDYKQFRRERRACGFSETVAPFITTRERPVQWTWAKQRLC